MSVMLIALSIGLFMLPPKYDLNELKPEQLLVEIIDETRFLTTDMVAEMIISEDPSIQLIDVRTPEEFKKFSLTRSINVPLKNLLDKNKKGKYVWANLLNQDTKKNIFYSNGSIYANQAWMLSRRLNFKNNYVMKGGLNYWIETIIVPKHPDKYATKDEVNLYKFRKGASMFFGGGTTTGSNTEKPKNIKIKTKVIKKKIEEEEGGC